jgi:hypothetical protein
MIDLLERELQSLNRTAEAIRFRWWAWPLAVIAGFVAGGFGSLVFDRAKGDAGDMFVGGMAFLGAFGMAALYALVMITVRQIIGSARRNLEHQITKARAEILKESIEEDFFTKLVKINFRYIDQYYYQTQQQADKSFRLSSVAATVGFGVMITGIIMMFLRITTSAYVTSAVGLISQFISAVFFYLYNRTILKMGQYHEKLVLTQNISVALKIAEGLPGEAKIQAQQNLIDRLTQDVNRYLAEYKKTPEV